VSYWNFNIAANLKSSANKNVPGYLMGVQGEMFDRKNQK
jgi:hypothetical protein